jgi:hypothetical protein
MLFALPVSGYPYTRGRPVLSAGAFLTCQSGALEPDLYSLDDLNCCTPLLEAHFVLQDREL